MGEAFIKASWHDSTIIALMMQSQNRVGQGHSKYGQRKAGDRQLMLSNNKGS